MTNMLSEITNIILAVAQELNENLVNKIPLKAGIDAPLFGQNGVLDSLGLVSLIVAVEQAIEEELNIELTIADEKALSQSMSPFRSIKSLSEYINNLIDKAD